MASDIWLGAGVILVVLSPFWGLVGAKIAVLFERIALSHQKGGERDIWTKSLEKLSLEELEKELQKAKFDKNWQKLAYTSESPGIIAEMEKRIPILEKMIDSRK